jgi:hypothetical protein
LQNSRIILYPIFSRLSRGLRVFLSFLLYLFAFRCDFVCTVAKKYLWSEFCCWLFPFNMIKF